MSTTVQQQICSKAADLLEDRRRWTRNADARDARSRPVAWSSEKAVRFCALGALCRMSTEHGISFSLVHSYTRKKSGRCLMTINDREGRKAVIEHLRWVAKGGWKSASGFALGVHLRDGGEARAE
jgi:hypothetical protein